MFEFKDLENYDNHEEIKFFQDQSIGLEGVIVFHRKRNGFPSFGTTTVSPFSSTKEMLEEALCHSKYNTLRLALLDLPYGGAKAYIKFSGNNYDKTKAILGYRSILNSTPYLVTSQDVGLSRDNLRLLSNSCSNVVGLNNNPSFFTSYGIFRLLTLLTDHNLNEKKVVVHGLSPIGTSLIKHLIEAEATVFVSSSDHQDLSYCSKLFPEITVVPCEETHLLNSDFFLSFENLVISEDQFIEEVRAEHILCSLPKSLNESAAQKLYRKGVHCFPSFLVNAGSIIYKTYEYENKLGVVKDELIFQSIEDSLGRVGYILSESKRLNMSVYDVSHKLAYEKMDKNHIDQNQLELALQIDPMPF